MQLSQRPGALHAAQAVGMTRSTAGSGTLPRAHTATHVASWHACQQQSRRIRPRVSGQAQCLGASTSSSSSGSVQARHKALGWLHVQQHRPHRRALSRAAAAGPADIPSNGASTRTEPTPADSSAQTDSLSSTAAGESSALSTSSSNGVPPVPQGKQPFVPHRWRVVAMMAAAFVLCNMDKVNMSVAVIPMAQDLGWSATDRGLVSSSFFWGYSLTQVPAGWISTRIGGAKVLMAGVALWSLGTLIAPPAAKLGLLALCASRVLVGLGEGFAPSAATSVLARLVPPTERARAVTAVWGGLDVGSAVGLLVAGPLIRMYGWPSVFYLFAVLGGFWCLAWPLLNPERDDEMTVAQREKDERIERGLGRHPGVLSSASISVDVAMLDTHLASGSMDEDAEYVMAAADAVEGKGSSASSDPQAVPWGEFMRSPPVWAVTVAHFCFNWGYYTLLAWLPSYFELALGLNVEKSSFLTLIPYVAMMCMTPIVGPVADGMVARGISLTNVRKFCQGLAFVGPAACMIACGLLTPATPGAPVQTWLLVGLLSVGFALGAWSRAGLYCNHQDLSPKYASALLGITNTAGALPGVLGVTSAGYLLDATGSWQLALFFPTAACQIVGAVVYSIFASSKRQSWS